MLLSALGGLTVAYRVLTYFTFRVFHSEENFACLALFFLIQLIICLM